MNIEQQRIAIAKCLGYPNPRMWEFGRCYAGELPHVEEVPDYLNDLNAMHDAERFLAEKDLVKYASIIVEKSRHLLGISNYESREPGQFIIRATAAVRAEAFLKTLNLWTT